MAIIEQVFSGVQPTGNLHLGNYLGAIVNFVKLQATHNCIYCVVDLHAITGPVSVWGGPDELRRNTREVTAAFIASGIDPKKQIIFNQSQVAEHAELAWVFNCVARLGWLNRMTQFKEKAGKDRENASIGLYDYPVLMASDILVYRATHVPVGEDQKQHLELSRDIAQKFNNDFSESIAAHGHSDKFFPLPEPVITGPATRVMSCATAPRKCRSPIHRTIRASTSPTMPTPSRRKSARPRPIRSRCRRKKKASRPRGGRQSGRHLCSTGGQAEIRSPERVRRRAVFRLQVQPGRSCGRQTVADRRRDEAADPGRSVCRLGPDRRRRPRPRHRLRNHERGEGHSRLRSQEVVPGTETRTPLHLSQRRARVAACGGLAQHRDMHEHATSKL